MTEREFMKKQNWEISYDIHLTKFREIDPTEAFVRTDLKFDNENSRFILETLGHQLYAEWPEFKLIPADEKTCPKTLYDFQMQVLAMRVLYLGVSAPSSGKLKAYRELPWGDVYDRNFNGRCIKRFAFGFGFNPDKFEKAAVLLGGTKPDTKGNSKNDSVQHKSFGDDSTRSTSCGDASFDFPFLGGIICRFILWKPDEEFPPSAQILFSDNSVLMYNAEDLASVGDVIITALKEVSS